MNCADARLARWSALAALALAVPGALAAQEATTRNHLYDKFQATADFTTVLNKSTARLDGSNGLGTTLDFTSLLGVSGTTIQPAIGLRWKPGRKNPEFEVVLARLEDLDNRPDFIRGIRRLRKCFGEGRLNQLARLRRTIILS